MDDVLLIGAAGILGLVLALLPEGNRKSVQRFFGGLNIGQTGGGAPVNSAPANNQRGDISSSAPQLPRNRILTEDEVRNLAAYVVNTHNLNMDAKQLLAVAFIESSFRPWVERDEGFDRSTGLMQTLLGTASDLYNKGYKAYGVPTRDKLKDPLISMYFGAAYFDWLKKGWPGRELEWYIRAYNGGPGWERTQRGPSMTAVYYEKWFQAIKRFSISIKFVGS